jgi:hypothetical protein
MKHLMKFEQFNLGVQDRIDESLSNKFKSAVMGLLMTLGVVGAKSQNIDNLMSNPEFSEKYHEVEQLVCKAGYDQGVADKVINYIEAKKLFDEKNVSAKDYKRLYTEIVKPYEDAIKSDKQAEEILFEVEDLIDFGVKKGHDLMSVPSGDPDLYRTNVLAPDTRPVQGLKR